ncbi:MAG: hypothetical protein ACR2H6_07815, partial [Pyrinomonadaceae bacterium]
MGAKLTHPAEFNSFAQSTPGFSRKAGSLTPFGNTSHGIVHFLEADTASCFSGIARVSPACDVGCGDPTICAGQGAPTPLPLSPDAGTECTYVPADIEHPQGNRVFARTQGSKINC